MNRYEFFVSIEETLPNFFPEVDKKHLKEYIYTDHSKLLFSITFFKVDKDGKNLFDHSNFDTNLRRFKIMLTRLGAIDMEDLITPEIKDYYQKHFFMLPAEIALKFTD